MRSQIKLLPLLACIIMSMGHLIAQPVSFDPSEINKEYRKLTEDESIASEKVNGRDIYKIYYCSIDEPLPKYGEFTPDQFNSLTDYKFKDWEKCVSLSELIITSFMVADIGEETMTIRSNATFFGAKTLEEGIDLGKASGETLIYTFDKLKKKYLDVELSHPNFDSEIAELDKKIRGGFVFMRMSQVTIDRLIKKYYDSNQLDSLVSLITFHPYSKSHLKTIVYADSIRLFNALKNGDERPFLTFINERPASPLMKLAEEWVTYFERAKSYYESAKQSNQIEDFEFFLANYDRSKFVEECKLKLVDAAAARYIQSTNPDSIVFFYTNYLLKYQDVVGFKKSYFTSAENNIMSALEKKYTGENRSDLSLEALTRMWEHKHKIEKEIATPLEKMTSRFQSPVCNSYFTLLTTSISLETQKAISESFVNTFYELASTEEIRFILDNTPNKNGTLKIFGVNYMVGNLKTMLNDTYSDEITYQSVTHSLKTPGAIETLSWVDNQYRGLQTVSNEKGKFYEINFTSYPTYDQEHFFKDGLIAKSSFYSDEGLLYTYEFMNGKNLTLAELQSQIDVGDNAFKEKRYEDALGVYISLLENPYPASTPQNDYLSKAIKKTEEKIRSKEIEEASKYSFSPAYRCYVSEERDGMYYDMLLIFPPNSGKAILGWVPVGETRASNDRCEGVFKVIPSEKTINITFSDSECSNMYCTFEFEAYTKQVWGISWDGNWFSPVM
ncbi:MAG: hypothetical protein ACKOYC_01400, partial [Bacteroidota bacterium]